MQHIIRHLFKVGSLDEVPKERLEELVQEYPSFSVGHYLLSSKLHAEDAANFTEETERTNLYFSNPFWLQWLLQNAGKKDGVKRSWPVARSNVEPLPAPELDRSEDAFEKLTPAERTDTAEKEPIIRAATEEGYVNAEELEEVEEEAVASAPEEVFAIERVVVEAEEPVIAGTAPWEEELETGNGEVVAAQPGVEESVAEEPVMADTTEQPVKEESSAEKLLKSILEARNLRQSLVEINQRIAAPAEEVPAATGEVLAITEEILAPVVNEILQEVIVHQEETPKVEESQSEPQPEPQQEAQPEEVPQEEPAKFVEAETSNVDAPHEEVVADAPVAEVAGNVTWTSANPTVDAPVVSESQAPVFESFHTIDYFASQGIKLSLDENPDDRLGRQMKSFTDWLKVMKRIPQRDAASIPDLAAEHQVQAIAAHSIEGKEVVTETMAEVLAKQGMREKATEVYRKLSLLNPDKSSYFAARIEQLKII
ncbi:MAG TPA: hypothetical protein VE035_17750 [Puia sp.]|nr:hypothetical protein [Puia sp.]